MPSEEIAVKALIAQGKALLEKLNKERDLGASADHEHAWQLWREWLLAVGGETLLAEIERLREWETKARGEFKDIEGSLKGDKFPMSMGHIVRLAIATRLRAEHAEATLQAQAQQIADCRQALELIREIGRTDRLETFEIAREALKKLASAQPRGGE